MEPSRTLGRSLEEKASGLGPSDAQPGVNAALWRYTRRMFIVQHAIPACSMATCSMASCAYGTRMQHAAYNMQRERIRCRVSRTRASSESVLRPRSNSPIASASRLALASSSFRSFGRPRAFTSALAPACRAQRRTLRGGFYASRVALGALRAVFYVLCACAPHSTLVKSAHARNGRGCRRGAATESRLGAGLPTPGPTPSDCSAHGRFVARFTSPARLAPAPHICAGAGGRAGALGWAEH